jgi:hypothetical protein
MRRLVPANSDAARLIELFARRQPAYGSDDVLRLIGISSGQLTGAIDAGAVTPERNDVGALVISWEDMAHLALDEWTPRMIEAALREESSEVIPPLNQHRLIQVSLPIYLIRLLDYQARFESATRHVPRNASDIIERVLREFADGRDTAALDVEIPGFRQALQYPYYTPRPDSISLRCRYCNTTITEAVREVCRACGRRHEPKEHLGEYGLPELEEEDEQTDR